MWGGVDTPMHTMIVQYSNKFWVARKSIFKKEKKTCSCNTKLLNILPKGKQSDQKLASNLLPVLVKLMLSIWIFCLIIRKFFLFQRLCVFRCVAAFCVNLRKEKIGEYLYDILSPVYRELVASINQGREIVMLLFFLPKYTC